MTPRFYLKEPKAKEPTLVYFIFHVFGFRAKKSTGIKIHPLCWNFKYGRVKQNMPNEIKINSFLDKLEDRAKTIRIEYLSEFKVPSRDEFLDRVFASEKPELNFFEKFDQFILAKSKLLSDKSINVYQSVRANLLAFNPKLSDLKKGTVDSLIEYLILKKYSPNYIEKHTGILSRFAKHINIPFDFSIKVSKRKTDSFALTLEEVKQLINCNNLTPDQAKIRDVFVFACYTGLRYSDVKLFNPSYLQVIEGKKCIVFFAKKTGNKSVIPVFEPVQEILKRYKNNLPPRLSSQKFNDNLKVVCRIAGLTVPVQVSKLKGLGKEIEVKPKYEIITSHVARRTFVTIMSTLGLTSKEISLMTGHTQQSIVDIYDKTKADANAVKILGKIRF